MALDDSRCQCMAHGHEHIIIFPVCVPCMHEISLVDCDKTFPPNLMSNTLPVLLKSVDFEIKYERVYLERKKERILYVEVIFFLTVQHSRL